MSIEDVLQPLHDHIAQIESERDLAIADAGALRAAILGLVPAAERILAVAMQLEARDMPTGAPALERSEGPAWVDEGHETLPIGLETAHEAEPETESPPHYGAAKGASDAAEWARRLDAGEKVKDIAREIGVSWQFIAMNAAQWRKAHGEPTVESEPEPEPKPTARRHAGGKPPRAPEEVAEWRRLKESGLSYREIAKRCHVGKHTVWTWLTKGGEPEPAPNATEAAPDHQVSAAEAAPEPPRMVTMYAPEPDPAPEPDAPAEVAEGEPELTRCIIGTLTNGRRYCRDECDAKRGCHLAPDGSCDQCMYYDDADTPCACWQPATERRVAAFERWVAARTPARDKVPAWNGRG